MNPAGDNHTLLCQDCSRPLFRWFLSRIDWRRILKLMTRNAGVAPSPAPSMFAWRHGTPHGPAKLPGPTQTPYTEAIGQAGDAYHRQFQHAHPLPALWRWSELWERMCAAAGVKEANRPAWNHYGQSTSGIEPADTYGVRGMDAQTFGAQTPMNSSHPDGVE